MESPKAGHLLIAEPFLKDPNFKRAVIFLCEHNKEGSFGLLLNKQLKIAMKDIFAQLQNCTIPVFFGGPVQMDTLHILHQLPSLIPNSFQIMNDLYWGGDINVIIDLIKTEQLDTTKIRFYLGYSGWDEGQLTNEFNEHKSWISVKAKASFIFQNNIQKLWNDALTLKGGNYTQWKTFPIDPQLN